MAGRFDPVLLEVLWSRLVAVVEEQATALMRTSFTSIVRDSGDLSAGVFDPRGRMIAQAVTGTPGHINAMATSVRHFLAEHPLPTLVPGDVLITNDPWKTSGHLHDFTVVTPVFRGPTLVALFANTCHAMDVGGRGLGAHANQVYEEGLFVPITKLYAAGEPNQELFRLLRANVRTPDQVLGDLHAQVAANDVGGARLLALLDEAGLDSIEALADEIIARSERAMRAGIRALPDGEYQAELWSDGFDEPVRIAVAVRVRGDEMVVDYAGTSPESPHGINVVYNYTHAYTTYAVKCAVCPEVPNNDGSFRPLRVAAPEGSILNARHPAAVGARHVIGHLLPLAVLSALAPAIPDRVPAEGAGNIWIVQASGVDLDGRPFTYQFFAAGGMGGRPTKDGLSNTAFPSGIRGVPIEVVETLSPLVLRERAIRPDSGGPGRWRGGAGQVLVLECRTRVPWMLSAMYDRTRFAPRGMAGGWDGARGAVELPDGRRLPPKGQYAIEPGDRVTLRLPGGAGFGDPLDRDPERVLADVRDGYVSPEQAREAYGVVLTGMSVDAGATQALREALRSARGRPAGEGRHG